jgi:SAM-dependent methyltransferase
LIGRYPGVVIRDAVSQGSALVQAEQPWGDAQLARLYDGFVFDGDLPLYLELARAQGSRVLEVACGSGRVLVPLVQAGFDVLGIDVSPHMLALAREKLDSMPDGAGTAGLQADMQTGTARPQQADMQTGSAQLQQADMRTFELDRTDFDLAICAVKSFAYLLEKHDQLRCLRTIADHLRPGGLLAIDFMHPQPDWLAAKPGAMHADLLQRVPQGGYTLSRVESVVSTDLARQVRVIRSAYELIDDRGALIEKRFVEWPYRWTHRFEAEHLLERAGFEVEAMYGSYAREPFSSASASMVFLARKPHTPG